ncbi:hypothetical protein SprV_0301265200 [Sparganum proliferum]
MLGSRHLRADGNSLTAMPAVETIKQETAIFLAPPPPLCSTPQAARTWEDLVQNRPAWRREVETGAVIYEANQIAAAKVRRAARKSQAYPIRNTAAQSHQTCPRGHRTFRARIGLIIHLRTQCTHRPRTAILASTTAPASPSTSTTSASTLTNAVSNPCDALPSANTTSTTFALTTAMTSNTIISTTTVNDQNTPGAPTTTCTFTITVPTSSDVDSAPSCPHCDHTLTSHIGLVSHLRIHRKETGAYDVHQHPPPSHNSSTQLDPSHVSGECVSRLLLNVAPLLHVTSESEDVTLRQASWLGRLRTDVSTQSTQSTQLCVFVWSDGLMS